MLFLTFSMFGDGVKYVFKLLSNNYGNLLRLQIFFIAFRQSRVRQQSFGPNVLTAFIPVIVTSHTVKTCLAPFNSFYRELTLSAKSVIMQSLT